MACHLPGKEEEEEDEEEEGFVVRCCGCCWPAGERIPAALGLVDDGGVGKGVCLCWCFCCCLERRGDVSSRQVVGAEVGPKGLPLLVPLRNSSSKSMPKPIPSLLLPAMEEKRGEDKKEVGLRRLRWHGGAAGIGGDWGRRD